MTPRHEGLLHEQCKNGINVARRRNFRVGDFEIRPYLRVQLPREPRPMRFVTIILLTLAARVLGSEVGDTYEKVVAEKGAPIGQIQAGSVRILSYSDVTIRIRDDVVVSIKAAPPPTPTPTLKPTTVPTPLVSADKVAAAKRDLMDAETKVREIINQPVPAVARMPNMNITWFGDAWFHPGATKPDFNTVDIRKTQDTATYSKFEYVSSNMTPTIAFPGSEVEFNSMTKFFYDDRTLPKKRLSEAEMIEVNRLYRIIGKCTAELDSLEPQAK